MLIFWIIVFVISLAALVKGADWLIESAEKIGLALGLSPFLVGVLIVGIGTSLPELVSSFTATVRGVSDVAVANTVGSNIANILLVVGIAAVMAKKLKVTKSLIDLDLPLLALVTILLGWCVLDGRVDFGESLILVVSYVMYLGYIIFHKEEENISEGLAEIKTDETKVSKRKVTIKDFLLLVVGVVCLVLGSDYLITSLVNLSEILAVATGLITITAVAIGTSLPELLVSVKAALKGKTDVAVGNIFGSNVFNSLVVVGLPGLFKTLTVDEKTLAIGLPVMALATLIFVISGSSRRVYIWEGLFYLSFYFLFVVKLFGWF